MRRWRRAASVTVLVALSMFVVGCGSSSSTSGSVSPSTSASAGLSASAYVIGVCGAFQDYANAVKQRQDAFKADGTDIAAVKQSWLDFLDGMIQDTTTLVTKIEALGVPDVSDGQAASSTLKSEFANLQADLQKLRDRSAGLPTSSPGAFTAAFGPLLKQFQTDMQGFGQDLNKFSGDELDAAFSAAPECAKVNVSTSA